MKQKLTSEDISSLIKYLNTVLDGCYLNQIYDGSEENTRTIVLKFRYKCNEYVKFYYLLIESGIRMHLIDEFESVRTFPSSLVSKLRKQFKDRRLWPIEQLGEDRCINFRFSNDNHFLVELYDKGNFIITDENYIITYLIRTYEINDKKIHINHKYPLLESKKINDNIISKGYVIPNNTFSINKLEGINVIEFENINDALKFYYKNDKKKKKKEINKKKERINNKKGNIEAQIDKLNNSEKKTLDKADKFVENINYYQSIINYVQNFIKYTRSFEELNDIIRLEFNNTNLKIDHEKLIIDDYILDYNKTAYDNVSKIYNQKKIFTHKKEKAVKIYNETKFDDKIENKEKIIITRKFHKFEDYWWFINDNIIVVCGKSADDNERILNNCEKNDILVHGHFDKSPWCIIKNPENKEISMKIINYAGNFLVHRSWNWVENCTNNSYYTYPDKISKSAPSGEFMGKGSRMVHEKNILANADMVSALTVIFRVGNLFTGTPNLDDKIEYGMVMCCPYNMSNDYIFKSKIKPNGTKKDKGRKKLLESIISKFLKLKIKDNRLKDYIKAIPYEEWDKVCIHFFTDK